MTHASTQAHGPAFFFSTDAFRLPLIAASISFVVLAGQFAHSRGQELSAAASQNILASATTGAKVTAHQIRSTHKSDALERFAISQARGYSELLDSLTERAEVVLQNTALPVQQQNELKLALRDLDQTLLATHHALANYRSLKANPGIKEQAFEEEDLRGSLVNLQQAASEAQGVLMSLDPNS